MSLSDHYQTTDWFYEREAALEDRIESHADYIRTEWENKEYPEPELITDYLDSDRFLEVVASLVREVSARPSLAKSLLTEDEYKIFESSIRERIREIAEGEVKDDL